MNTQKDYGNEDQKAAQREAQELGYLWKNYVDNSGKMCKRPHCVRLAAGAVALLLIVVALFIDDNLAWSALYAIADVLNDTADNVADALGVQRD